MVPPVRGRLVAVLAAALTLTACAAVGKPTAAPTTTAARSSASGTTATTTPTPSTRAVAVAPPGGSALTLFTGDGRVNVIAGHGGFAIVQSRAVSVGPTGVLGPSTVDRSTITTYDVAGTVLAHVPGGAFTGDCGAADVSPGGHRLIVAAQLETKPAQGVIAAQYAEKLVAFDATTGAAAWSSMAVPFQSEQLSCQADNGRLDGFQATRDGAWGSLVVGTGNNRVAMAINLATGDLLPKADVLGALGNFLVTGTHNTDANHQPDVFALSTPPTWQGAGSFSTGSGKDLIPISDPKDASYWLFTRSGTNSEPGVGLSSDATLLFVSRRNSTDDGTLLQAFSLPGMTKAWEQNTTNGIGYSLIGSGGDVLVVQRTATDGVTTVGLNARTGATLWTLPKVDNICGLTTSQMLVQANDQSAVIELKTGKQLEFSTSSSSYGSSCPSVLPGGIAATTAAGNGLSVVQVLAP